MGDPGGEFGDRHVPVTTKPLVHPRQSSPRHILNGGGAGAGAGGEETPLNFKIVNAFNDAEMLERALSTRVGERVMINFINRNQRAINSASGR